MPQTVLIADRDDSFVQSLADNLAADHFEVVIASTGDAVYGLAEDVTPHVILLGDLPSRPVPVAVLNAIRAGDQPFNPKTGVVVFTPAGATLEVVRAFEHGADDVVPRDIAYPELRARLCALLRRRRPHQSGEVLRVGDLEVNTRKRHVTVSGESVTLTQAEFRLLLHLAREPDRVFTKAELTHDLWGYPHGSRTRTVDSHACRLRRKLTVSGNRAWVRNIWGVGYSLIEADEYRLPRNTRRTSTPQTVGSG